MRELIINTQPVSQLIVNKANQSNYLFINILPLVEVSLDSNLETRYNDLWIYGKSRYVEHDDR